MAASANDVWIWFIQFNNLFELKINVANKSAGHVKQDQTIKICFTDQIKQIYLSESSQMFAEKER